MLVIATDLEVTDFSLQLCKGDGDLVQCSDNLAIRLGARMPAHEDFVPYKSGKRKRPVNTVTVGSIVRQKHR